MASNLGDGADLSVEAVFEGRCSRKEDMMLRSSPPEMSEGGEVDIEFARAAEKASPKSERRANTIIFLLPF